MFKGVCKPKRGSISLHEPSREQTLGQQKVDGNHRRVAAKNTPCLRAWCIERRANTIVSQPRKRNRSELFRRHQLVLVRLVHMVAQRSSPMLGLASDADLMVNNITGLTPVVWLYDCHMTCQH